MNWLVSTALHLRVPVLALSIVLLILGVRTATQVPLDVFPEFAPPLVEIQTEAPGLSADEVESLISVPLESALIGTSWLKTLRSKSVQGLSSVVMLFEEGTDLMRARQLVSERIATEGPRLPAVARPPVILSPLSSLSRVMKIGFSSKKLSQMELTELARWTIRPRLMSVAGVANVAIWGQRDRQLQVLVDPDRLRARGVGLDAVVRATGDAVAVAAGGFLDSPNQRLGVRQSAYVSKPEDLARALITFRDGAPVRIGDVARVVVGHPPPIGDGVINDAEGLLLIVEKQPWGNTLEVTRRVEKALDAFRPQMPDVAIDSTIFRPATFIERSISNLGEAMIIGCILVAVILMIFLADWRTAFISITAIPLSIVGAILVLHYRGGTVDTMVLAGLVIALGEVVDDAIIDVENIVRRLRLERAKPSPRPALEVVLDASLEVRSAVVFASLVVILVFLPIFFLDGLAGSFFRPLALSYVIAILASLLVALTVTPALCLMLLPGTDLAHREPFFARALKRAYRALLERLVHWPKAAGLTITLCLVIAGIAMSLLGEAFMPRFKETDFLMHWVAKPGTSLLEMKRITIAASRELLTIPGVRNQGAHIGRAEVADEVVGPNFVELWISIDPSNYDETIRRVQEAVDGYPGLYRDLLTYLTERIKEVLTGASAALVVRISGPDLAVLRSRAGEMKTALSAVPGLRDLKVESQVLVPQVDVKIRPEAAARYGLTAGQARRAVSTVVSGTKVGELYADQKIIPVVVWGEEAARRDANALRQLPIETGLGPWVPLSAVADVQVIAAPNEIKREGGSRRIDVTANLESGADLGKVAREVAAAVATVKLGSEYHAEVKGEYAARQASRRRLLELSLLALLGIVLLLQVDLGAPRLVALVLFTLPFALVGGVAGAWLSGGVVSLGSLVGFVTVLGIAARNGIMLISHYRHLEEVEGRPFGLALVLEGAEERLVPIVMTAACAGLALLPLIWRGPVPGHEIEHPMAWVILGGLFTSTALNIFLMPPLYLAVMSGRRPAELPPV